MKNIHSLRSLACAAVLLVSTLPPAAAQEKNSAVESHPASVVVKNYMEHMLSQDWEKASSIVEEKSMETLRDDYLKRMKRPGAMSLDEEKELLEKFQVKRLEEVASVAGKKFYVTFHNLLKAKNPTSPEMIKKVKESMDLKFLSVAEEPDGKAHVLVRTNHTNDKVRVENLELISLVKSGGKWLVALNEQTPKITPVAKSGASTETKPGPAAPSTSPKAKPVSETPTTPKRN
jgi:hypothetical protein